MFDQIGRAAERAAAGVSRRQFLGRFGRGAVAAAAALGGLLALPTATRAAAGVCSGHSARGCRNKPVGSRCGNRSGYCLLPPNCQCIGVGP
jgi:hypothetical protein